MTSFLGGKSGSELKLLLSNKRGGGENNRRTLINEGKKKKLSMSSDFLPGEKSGADEVSRIE